LPRSGPAVGAPERVLAGAPERRLQVLPAEATGDHWPVRPAQYRYRYRPRPGEQGPGPDEDFVAGRRAAPRGLAALTIPTKINFTDGRAAAATGAGPHCLVLLLGDDFEIPGLRLLWDGPGPALGAQRLLDCHALLLLPYR